MANHTFDFQFTNDLCALTGVVEGIGALWIFPLRAEGVVSAPDYVVRDARDENIGLGWCRFTELNQPFISLQIEALDGHSMFGVLAMVEDAKSQVRYSHNSLGVEGKRLGLSLVDADKAKVQTTFRSLDGLRKPPCSFDPVTLVPVWEGDSAVNLDSGRYRIRAPADFLRAPSLMRDPQKEGLWLRHLPVRTSGYA